MPTKSLAPSLAAVFVLSALPAAAELSYSNATGGTVKLYGQLSPGYLSFNDGVASYGNLVDNEVSNSRAGITVSLAILIISIGAEPQYANLKSVLRRKKPVLSPSVRAAWHPMAWRKLICLAPRPQCTTALILLRETTSFALHLVRFPVSKSTIRSGVSIPRAAVEFGTTARA